MWDLVKQKILWPISYPFRMVYCYIKRNELDDAMRRGNVEIAEKFLKLGANPNGHKKLRYLPYTTDSGRKNLLELLIKYKADLGYKNKDGNTLLHTAVNNWGDKTEISQLLLRTKP